MSGIMREQGSHIQNADFMNVLNLFPWSAQTLVSTREVKFKALQLLEFFLTQMMHAVTLFYREGRLDLFDPHVGDTLCQIRAYQTLYMIRESFGPQKQNEVERLKLEEFQKKTKQEISEFLLNIHKNKGRYYRELDASETLENFFTRKKLNFYFPNSFVYLLQNKILTDFSKKNYLNAPVEVDYESIRKALDIGKSGVKKLLRHFQVGLSQLSSRFLKESVSSAVFQESREILKRLELVDNHQRLIPPCYEATKQILAHALSTGCPILILVHQISAYAENTFALFFKPSLERDDFIFQEQVSFAESNEPCLVIQGDVTYKPWKPFEAKESFIKRFTEAGLLTVLLANMAKHPQYSAQEFQEISNNPYQLLYQYQPELLKNCVHAEPPQSDVAMTKLARQHAQELKNFQEIAENLGCCLSHQGLFFVKHIVCGVPRYYLSEKECYKEIFLSLAS